MKNLLLFILIVSFLCCQGLKIGMIEWIGYAGNNVALEKGYWEGLDTKVIVYSSRAELEKAFTDGDIDIMHNALAKSLQYIFKGIDVVNIMQTGYSSGGDKVIIKRDLKLKLIVLSINQRRLY